MAYKERKYPAQVWTVFMNCDRAWQFFSVDVCGIQADALGPRCSQEAKLKKKQNVANLLRNFNGFFGIVHLMTLSKTIIILFYGTHVDISFDKMYTMEKFLPSVSPKLLKLQLDTNYFCITVVHDMPPLCAIEKCK